MVTRHKVNYTVKAKGFTYIFAKDAETAKEMFDPDWVTVDENHLKEIEIEIDEVDSE